MDTVRKLQKLEEKAQKKLDNALQISQVPLNQENENKDNQDNKTEKENALQLLLVKEQKNIPSHCILKAQAIGKEIITLDGWKYGFNNIVVWNTEDWSEIQRIEFPHSSRINDFKVIKYLDEQLMLVCSEDKKIHSFIRQIDKNYSQNELFKLKQKPFCLGVDEEKLILFVGTKSGQIISIKLHLNVFDVHKESEVAKKVSLKFEIINEFMAHERQVNGLIFFKNKLLSVGEDKAVVCYNLESNSILQKRRQNSCVRSYHLNLDKEHLITGNNGGEIIIYSASTLEQIKRIEINSYIQSLLFINVRESNYILLSTNKRIWMVFCLQQNRIIQESSKYNDYISCIIRTENNSIFIGEGKNLFQIWSERE